MKHIQSFLLIFSALLLRIHCETIDNTIDVDRNETSISRNIVIEGDDFILDGKKLYIRSGSLHYFRLPSVLWRDRLEKLKAAGLNTVSTYIEWSYHETEEREYNFEGDRDVAQFVRLAAEVGLHVLLRPGPYICAERDLGGLPYWLLGKYPGIRLRTIDSDFMSESRIWLDKLFERLSPLLYGNGGPIILVQIENEYGSYGADKQYMGQMRDIIQSHVQQNAILYSTDGGWPSYYLKGCVDGVLCTVDFGPGANVSKTFSEYRKYFPIGPLMNSEYYPGWLTHWTEPFQRVSTKNVVDTLNAMLDLNVHFNFYMFFGGSNFEFTSGANFAKTYQPDITSYDYDAPLSEAGDLTEKYYAIRDILSKRYPEVQSIAVPPPSQKRSYGTVDVKPRLEILSSEGRSELGKVYKSVNGKSLPTFEALRQRAGFVLYESVISGLNHEESTLTIDQPRDRVYVYVNGVYEGKISRMDTIRLVNVKLLGNDTISLLVENQGRINYGHKLHDFKGILGPVVLGNKTLAGPWKVTGFPLQNVDSISTSEIDVSKFKSLQNGPVFYSGDFMLPSNESPQDTFVDTTGWGKGYMWVNGYNLGRYWPHVGPQVTLYLPGVWLKAPPATNHIQILELEAPSPNLSLNLRDEPILNGSLVKKRNTTPELLAWQIYGTENN